MQEQEQKQPASDPAYFDIHLLRECPFVGLVLIVSCIPFIILNFSNLDALLPWRMPNSLIELITPFSIWRVWAPTFVHYTWLHIITNLLLWWIFAPKIEKESTTKLIILTIVIAGVSNMSQWWFAGAKFGGLSGVIYGLMGYLWLLQHFAGKDNYRFDPVIAVLMLAALPLSALGILDQQATYAHLSGLLCGGLLAVGSIALGFNHYQRVY
jgi:GlpG protein